MILNERELRARIKFHKETAEQLESKLKEFNKREILLRGSIREVGSLYVVHKAEGVNASNNSATNLKLAMQMVREGRVITCTITDVNRTNIKGVGVARCCDDDDFDINKGMKLAELRAKKDLYDCVAKNYEERL